MKGADHGDNKARRWARANRLRGWCFVWRGEASARVTIEEHFVNVIDLEEEVSHDLSFQKFRFPWKKKKFPTPSEYQTIIQGRVSGWIYSRDDSTVYIQSYLLDRYLWFPNIPLGISHLDNLFRGLKLSLQTDSKTDWRQRHLVLIFLNCRKI